MCAFSQTVSAHSPPPAEGKVKVSIANSKETNASRSVEHAAYQMNKLRIAQRNVHVLASIASVVNFLFLAYDFYFLPDRTMRIVIALLRYGFSILLLFMIRVLQNTRSFRSFAVLVTVLETLFLMLFFCALWFYDNPSFLIQSMGLISSILVIFIIPNERGSILALSLAAMVVFFVLVYFGMKHVSLTDMAAAFTYSTLTIVLCAVTVFGNEKSSYRDFVERAHLEQASSTDFLTSAVTRSRLEDEARRWMSFCRRQGLPLCLVFVDVDNLKRINDQFSHAAGDAVLKQLASVMRRQLRNSDTIARWGGDEFVLLLPNVSLQNAVILLDRVKQAVQQVAIEGIGTISCSYGVVEMGPKSTYQELLTEADALMYRSKRNGKGRISFDAEQA